MLPNFDELALARTDPGRMLAVAAAYSHELQFTEALQWFRTYLCHCPQDDQARQAMRALEASQADYSRLRDVYDFVDKCSTRLHLSDTVLAENLRLLHLFLGRGACEDAEVCARLAQQQLESLMRTQWQLGEEDDIWWEAVQRASARELYDMAVELLEHSPRHFAQVELYEAMAMGFSLLEDFGHYSVKRGWRETTQRLREAIQSRDLDAMKSCISQIFELLTGEDSGDDAPGLGVPLRPRPPSLDGKNRGFEFR